MTFIVRILLSTGAAVLLVAAVLSAATGPSTAPLDDCCMGEAEEVCASELRVRETCGEDESGESCPLACSSCACCGFVPPALAGGSDLDLGPDRPQVSCLSSGGALCLLEARGVERPPRLVG